MKFESVIKNIKVSNIHGSTNWDISDIFYNSKDVVASSCFVAIKGVSVDGHDFIDDAIAHGAMVIVSEKPLNVEATVVVVDDTKRVMAEMSANFFGHPSKKIHTIGVTGTNGKTTITYLLESIINENGGNVGVVGTVNRRYSDKELPAPHTTPMSYDLQKLMNEMAKDKVTDAVIEVSSHSLDQKRVYSTNFDTAIFTNLTHDHLDYHHGTEKYFEAKKKLFEEYLCASSKTEKYAIINIDDEFGRRIISECGGFKFVTYGFNKEADVHPASFNSSVTGNDINIKTPWGEFECASKLRGEFNILNVLAAVAATGIRNYPLNIIKTGIEKLTNVPGRLESVKNDRGISIFVDYAHTPDALRNSASSISKIKKGRLITVFGCGGDRDREKRPLMGREASLFSDVIIITSDNPRTEDPKKIINEIASPLIKEGMPLFNGGGRGYLLEEDRRKAIKKAISVAKEGDSILIAGKGHEDYQIVGKEKRHFDDVEVVQECLSV